VLPVPGTTFFFGRGQAIVLPSGQAAFVTCVSGDTPMVPKPRRPRPIPAPAPPKGCCGPEIYRSLVSTFQMVKNLWNQNPSWRRVAACGYGVGWIRWDIAQLFSHTARFHGNRGNCGPNNSANNTTNCCNECFTVKGFMHDMHEINYVLWGYLMCLCGWGELDATQIAQSYKGLKRLKPETDPCHLQGNQFTGSLVDWIVSGYRYAGCKGGPEGIKPGTSTFPQRCRKLEDCIPKYHNTRFSSCHPCCEPITGRKPCEAQLDHRSFDFELFIGLEPGTYYE
jgi:hypothetical protein